MNRSCIRLKQSRQSQRRYLHTQNETMSAQEDNSDVLNKITDRMQQLIELTKQEA